MSDQSFASNPTAKPIGLMALIRELDLPVRLPTVQSWSRSGARKTHGLGMELKGIAQMFWRKICQDSPVFSLVSSICFEPTSLCLR